MQSINLPVLRTATCALLVQEDVSVLSKGKGVGIVSAFWAQEFLRVYDVLRGELIEDDLIAAQPGFSAEYMKKLTLSQC